MNSKQHKEIEKVASQLEAWAEAEHSRMENTANDPIDNQIHRNRRDNYVTLSNKLRKVLG